MELQQDTSLEKIDGLVLFREDCDLVIRDEMGHSEKKAIAVGLFLGGGSLLMLALTWQPTFECISFYAIFSLFSFSATYLAYQRGRHPIHVRLSRENGLTLEENGEVLKVPISSTDEVELTEEFRGERVIPVLRTQESNVELTRMLRRGTGEHVKHEVMTWLKENSP